MEVFKHHTNCRVCGSDKLIKYFDAGLMPLANNNTATKEQSLESERYPLQVMFCNECGLSQLSVVIDPIVMFSNYDYRSAVNAGYVQHCKDMAIQLRNKYDLTKDSLHIDLAGNDGTLLKQFQNLIDLNALNIDPAANLTAIAEMNGINCITKFWSTEVAENLFYKSDLITATNVFAHVDGVNDFIRACDMALLRNGVLILEFPYLVDFIEKMEFDTIYHEHLSYFSVLPLMRLCSVNGMVITCIEKFDIHGGSLRVHISHEDSDHLIESSVSQFVNNELKLGYNKIEKYLKWSDQVEFIGNQFVHRLQDLKDNKYKIAGFAASAKGNTLLNYTHTYIDYIDYIVDETPEKIGKYYSGTGIQIVNKSELIKNPPDYLIILSWNFASDIISKCKKLGYKGKFIIPIPNFEIID